MNNARFHTTYDLPDNGGRRSGIERRRFAYTGHIPERRSGEDRRRGPDRRCGKDRRAALNGELRETIERRVFSDRRMLGEQP